MDQSIKTNRNIEIENTVSFVQTFKKYIFEGRFKYLIKNVNILCIKIIKAIKVDSKLYTQNIFKKCSLRCIHLMKKFEKFALFLREIKKLNLL